MSIPDMERVRLPMRDLTKPWYVPHLKSKYPGHPPAFDWNLETAPRGNVDYGEALVAPWSGVITAAYNFGGKRGRIIQLLGRTADGALYVWTGWHLSLVCVRVGEVVYVGDVLGEIGNADGKWYAHLHEQIGRVKDRGLPLATTYVSYTYHAEWLNCGEFYTSRGVDPDLVRAKTEDNGR